MNTTPDWTEQLTASEVEAERRNGRRRTRARRVAKLPPFCSARQAAWALLLSHPELMRLVRPGRLRGRQVSRGYGQFRWEFERRAVIELAESLE